jgi:cell division protein FtsB
VCREQEFNRLKKSYKDLKENKLNVDTSNEQRIEQYNSEIRENKSENEKLSNRIKDLEDEIEETVEHYSKARYTFKSSSL